MQGVTLSPRNSTLCDAVATPCDAVRGLPARKPVMSARYDFDTSRRADSQPSVPTGGRGGGRADGTRAVYSLNVTARSGPLAGTALPLSKPSPSRPAALASNAFHFASNLSISQSKSRVPEPHTTRTPGPPSVPCGGSRRLRLNAANGFVPLSKLLDGHWPRAKVTLLTGTCSDLSCVSTV